MVGSMQHAGRHGAGDIAESSTTSGLADSRKSEWLCVWFKFLKPQSPTSLPQKRPHLLSTGLLGPFSFKLPQRPLEVFSKTTVKVSGCFFPQMMQLATVTEVTGQYLQHIQRYLSSLSVCELATHLFDFMIDTRIWVKIVKSKLQIPPWPLNIFTIKQFGKEQLNNRCDERKGRFQSKLCRWTK